MGNWIFRKKKSDFETALKDIDYKITQTDGKIKMQKLSQRRSLSFLLVVMPLLEILYIIYWYFFSGMSFPHFGQPDLTINILFLLPIVCIPIGAYFISIILALLYRYRIGSWEKQLEKLKKEQFEKLEELRNSMDFKKNFNLLLQYSQKLSQTDPAGKLSIWEGIDFPLLIKQFEYILDIQKQVHQKQKEAEIEEERVKQNKLIAEQRSRKAQQQQQQLQHQQQQKMDIQRSHQNYSRTGESGQFQAPPEKVLAEKLQPRRALPIEKPYEADAEPISDRAKLEAVKTNDTLVTPKRSGSDFDIAQLNKARPEFKPKVIQVGRDVPNQWFDKILDTLMGGEDFNLICGKCGKAYACVNKDESTQDFVCRYCDALNKQGVKPEPDKTTAQMPKENIVTNPKETTVQDIKKEDIGIVEQPVLEKINNIEESLENNKPAPQNIEESIEPKDPKLKKDD